MAPKSLSALTARGESFEVGEHRYTVLPLKLKDVDEFASDNLSIGAQLFNLIDQQAKETVGKWLSRQVRDAKGEPLTLVQAFEDEWDLSDLRDCLRKLAGVSG